jgi:hypothetical protein
MLSSARAFLTAGRLSRVSHAEGAENRDKICKHLGRKCADGRWVTLAARGEILVECSQLVELEFQACRCAYVVPPFNDVACECQRVLKQMRQIHPTVRGVITQPEVKSFQRMLDACYIALEEHLIQRSVAVYLVADAIECVYRAKLFIFVLWLRLSGQSIDHVDDQSLGTPSKSRQLMPLSRSFTVMPVPPKVGRKFRHPDKNATDNTQSGIE